jgi:hypothetical protein
MDKFKDDLPRDTDPAPEPEAPTTEQEDPNPVSLGSTSEVVPGGIELTRQFPEPDRPAFVRE